MRHAFALFTVAVTFLLAGKPTAAVAGVPGVGDQLALSITNKYGYVLANPTVSQILGDGLVLQRGALVMKVRYDDMPPDIRQKYQPLATRVIKQQEQEGAANAAYLGYTRQLQVQQAQHLAAQEAQENQQATERAETQAVVAQKYLSIAIPNQSWKLTIANFGFGGWAKQDDNNQFVLRGQTGPGGFNFSLFVENPANNLSGNDPVYNFYWSNMAHDSLIDAQSVKVEREDKFIKVSYSAQGQPNVNYFFAYQGKWVDVHLSKGVAAPGDDKLFAAFDAALSYGP